jgi:hypothetical protein
LGEEEFTTKAQRTQRKHKEERKNKGREEWVHRWTQMNTDRKEK